MAFSCGFFNSKGLDRTYTAENFTEYLGSIICNGILDTYGQNFKLTAASSGLKVILGTGKAWIDGHYFVNESRYTIDRSTKVRRLTLRRGFYAPCPPCLPPCRRMG